MNLPSHLNTAEALGLVDNHPIAQYEIGDYKNFIYLVLDWKTRKAAIVDPQEDLTAPLKGLRDHGFELTGILLTHTHFDHIAGVLPLIESDPKLPVYVHVLDRHRLPSSILEKGQIQTIQDQQMISVGELELQVLHTPGHSAGECCYLLQDHGMYLFTGDTVFIRDCGRTDLKSGSTADMFASLQRIRKLPPETVILPGHHYRKECASTLETELRESPPFQCTSVTELEALP